MKIMTKKKLKNLENCVNKFRNCLLKEEQNFPTEFLFSTSNFYGLPKFCNSKVIQKAIQV